MPGRREAQHVAEWVWCELAASVDWWIKDMCSDLCGVKCHGGNECKCKQCPASLPWHETGGRLVRELVDRLGGLGLLERGNDESG